MPILNCCFVGQQFHEEETFEQDDKGNIVDYCKSLINVQFYGEQTGAEKRPFEHDPKDNDDCDLGSLLKIFNILLIQLEQQGVIDRYNSDVSNYLWLIAKKRVKLSETTSACYKRLMTDLKTFLPLYKKRAVRNYDLVQLHWGSRQQLRAGKVIADHVSNTDHILDPIFGVLLCPFAGFRNNTVGSFTNSQLDSYDISDNFWFDYDRETKAFHAVMSDAFGYLKDYHGIGPGASYLAQFELFNPDPLSGQTTSLLFWKRLLHRIAEEDLDILFQIL